MMRMKTHLFFCGIKHSGKSTLGRIVSSELGYDWVDLDDLILERLDKGTTIRSFYQQQGKEAFMQMEVEALKAFLASAEGPAIISLGGGACDNEALTTLVKKNGKVVYLVVEEAVLLKRILRGGVPPFLDPNDIQRSFSRLYARRHECYGSIADFLIHLPDYPDVRDTADYLVKQLANEV